MQLTSILTASIVLALASTGLAGNIRRTAIGRRDCTYQRGRYVSMCQRGEPNFCSMNTNHISVCPPSAGLPVVDVTGADEAANEAACEGLTPGASCWQTQLCCPDGIAPAPSQTPTPIPN
ncbi:hypothetical protein LZ554_001512 [Drepanopeziza brunnea f. sp. 'monogermtubi']|nr:hypothetical protein LZ554_001512 [Drepanopeziza brunnea f. sp. 'monogermtubi']